MQSNRLLRRAVLCLGLWSCLAAAESIPASSAGDPQPLPALDEIQGQPSWFEAIWNLPILRFFNQFNLADPMFPEPEALMPAPPPPPPCSIDPLPPIEDADALEFEESAQDGPRVDLTGLTPATSRALARFQRIVTSAGGDLWLTSAYRPAAYQEHLQAVWDKWMELRDNVEPGCQNLKTEVAGEFSGHQLLVRQRPVSFSDHTRGTGFDAAVKLPAARPRRRRVSLDRLARLAGIHRPDVAHDPVHFRLIARVSRS